MRGFVSLPSSAHRARLDAPSARLFRAGEFKTQLQGFADAFARHQHNLVAVLTVRTAAATKDILDNISVLTADTERVQRTLDRMDSKLLPEKVTADVSEFAVSVRAFFGSRVYRAWRMSRGLTNSLRTRSMTS